MGALRRVVGVVGFGQAMGVGERQAQRYCANQLFSEQPERNPLDKLGDLLALAQAAQTDARPARIAEIDALIDAALTAMARPVGRVVERERVEAPADMTMGQALGGVLEAVGMLPGGVGLYPAHVDGAVARAVAALRVYAAVYEREFAARGLDVRLSAGDFEDPEAERLAGLARRGRGSEVGAQPGFLRRLLQFKI
ncbi:hypothetical protein [Desulfocurvus sp. DL9XJH121]